MTTVALDERDERLEDFQRNINEAYPGRDYHVSRAGGMLIAFTGSADDPRSGDKHDDEGVSL